MRIHRGTGRKDAGIACAEIGGGIERVVSATRSSRDDRGDAGRKSWKEVQPPTDEAQRGRRVNSSEYVRKEGAGIRENPAAQKG